MRIAIHTQYYPPEMGAPQARLSELAKYFATRGHEVHVLTAMPNYPQGKIFPGYGGLLCREGQDGISVIRTWIYPTKSPNLIKRLMSYLSFTISSFWGGIFALPRVDFLVTETPPLFLGITGWLLSKIKRARWVMNVSDLWPDSAKYVGMMSDQSLAYRALEGLANFLYRMAWLVTGQSREIVNEIQLRVPSLQVHHLSNGADTESFSPHKKTEEIRQRYLKNGETGFVYAGLHGLFQGLEQVLVAAGRLRERPLRFVLVGDGPEKERLVRKAQELDLPNVDFYPPIPHQEMPGVLASFDVAIIPLKSSIRGAVPSKIYEAMASGIPILLMANGEAGEIVRQTGAGVTAKPGRIDELIHLVNELAFHGERRKAMGKAGRLAAEIHYDRCKIAEKFEEVLLRGETEERLFSPQRRR
jgi:colanic acid biosynthesis glycosyl transferase WcaI